MFAKLVDATIDPARLDLVAAAVDAELIPAFLDHDGALHGYWSADARTGHVVAITMWRDAESLRAAAAADGALRATVGERIGLGLRSVHTLAVLDWAPGADPWTDASEVGSIRLDWTDRLAPGADRVGMPEVGGPEPGGPGVGEPVHGCAGRYWLGEGDGRDGCVLSLWRDAAGPSADEHTVARRRRRREGTRRSRPVREYRTFGIALPTADRVPGRPELAGV